MLERESEFWSLIFSLLGFVSFSSSKSSISAENCS